MDVEHLIGTMISGALSGGRKRSRRASRYLRGGGGSFLNASTLLTLGGLAWGVFETMQRQKAGTASTPATPQPSGAAGPTAWTAAPLAGAPPAALPPVPGAATADPVPEGAAKLVRLLVSAARADGDFSEAERAAILEHARAAGAEALVAEEMARPTPLARIVEGITDARQRADLYVLAFGIVRGDESVSGAERIYLAQLAALLALEPEAVERLEREAAERIDKAQ